jgi:hypothetical protein
MEFLDLENNKILNQGALEIIKRRKLFENLTVDLSRNNILIQNKILVENPKIIFKKSD